MFHVVVLVLTIFLSNGDHKTLAIDDLPIRGDAPAQIGNDVCVCPSVRRPRPSSPWASRLAPPTRAKT
jgi:hypothetical protein